MHTLLTEASEIYAIQMQQEVSINNKPESISRHFTWKVSLIWKQ